MACIRYRYQYRPATPAQALQPHDKLNILLSGTRTLSRCQVCQLAYATQQPPQNKKESNMSKIVLATCIKSQQRQQPRQERQATGNKTARASLHYKCCNCESAEFLCCFCCCFSGCFCDCCGKATRNHQACLSACLRVENTSQYRSLPAQRNDLCKCSRFRPK